MRTRTDIFNHISLLMIGLTIFCGANQAVATEQNTLVFVKETKDKMGLPNMVLESIQADGSGRRVIFDAAVQEAPEEIPFPKRQRTPDISPAGKQIVLRRSWTVSVMNWDGSGAVNVTPYRREWLDPRWSPDGKQLVLCSDIRDLAEIFVVNADGSDLHNVTWKGRSNERSPDWSPDGKRICFISDRNGKFELFTMNADGMEQTRIISLDGDIREPDWGPNNQIAFALQKANGTSVLYKVDPDGENLKALTDGAFWDGQPAWDAEGKRLAFVSNRDGDSDIWVLDVASGDTHNVTRNPAHSELFPVWVPTQISDKVQDVSVANIAGLELPRPRMLFRAEDLPAIRTRLAQPIFAPVWASFLKNCDALCNPESKVSQKVEASIAAIKDHPSKGLYDRSAWIKPVFDLSFAWQVTSDEKYGQRAADWLISIAEEYAKWHQLMVFEAPTACSYDWLHSLFSPEDLNMLNGILQTTAKSFFSKISDVYFGETTIIESNFATHDAGSYGPAFLALSGEPGSQGEWLPAAARLTTINLNTWIGESGDAAEGTSYFNRPVDLMMPFMVSLKCNGLYPETRQSNLKKFADWLAVVNAGGHLPSLGDSDGGRIHFPVGLLRLYPDNETARKLWNSIERPDKPKRDVLSLLWFEPSENKAQDFTGFPKTAYLRNQNYQIFRSGYDNDSRFLTFALTAGGHAHSECGAIALRGFGEELLVDPGQAVSAADCHSQVLIDGLGRFVNYRSADTPREKMSPIKSTDFASASSVDMPSAFATRETSTHGLPTYSIPGPGMKLSRGGRTIVMVGDDTTSVPPYYLIRDDVQLDDQAHLYEQLFIGDADMNVRDNGDGSFVMARRYSGSWLAPQSGKKGDAVLDFNVSEAGEYQVWIYMKSNPDSKRTGQFAWKLGDSKYSGSLAFKSRCRNSWQWLAAGDVLPLTIGKHQLRLLPRNTIAAKVALIPGAKAKDYSGWGDLPDGSLVRSYEDAVVTGGAWVQKSSARAPAELLVASLNNDTTTFQTETFSFKTRFYGHQFITLPRTKLVQHQVEANFLTLVYPYLPGMQQPEIRKENDGATILWKDVTDTVHVQDSTIMVQRTHKSGKEERFQYQREF